MSHRLPHSGWTYKVSGTHHMEICNLGQGLDGSHWIAVFLRGSIVHGLDGGGTLPGLCLE